MSFLTGASLIVRMVQRGVESMSRPQTMTDSEDKVIDEDLNDVKTEVRSKGLRFVKFVDFFGIREYEFIDQNGDNVIIPARLKVRIVL